MNKENIVNYIRKHIAFVTALYEENIETDKYLSKYEIDFFEWQEIIMGISEKYDILPEYIEKAKTINELTDIILKNINKK